MDLNKRPIGIFDSGVGGLTVLKNIVSMLPGENIIYLGDTGRVPYGNKSRETIIKYSIENMHFLLRQQVKYVVVACNTASALALEYIQNIFNIPICGVILPGVMAAHRCTENNKVGVIGTRMTIRSNAYKSNLEKCSSQIKVFQQSCPLFVPFVEEGILNGNILNQIVGMYLRGVIRYNVDTVILGCTHYPLLKPLIRKYVGRKTHLIDSGLECARFVKHDMIGKKLLNGHKTGGKTTYYVTDNVPTFYDVAKLFLKDISMSQMSICTL